MQPKTELIKKQAAAPTGVIEAKHLASSSQSNDKLTVAFNLMSSCTDKTPNAATASWKEIRNEMFSRIPDDRVGDKNGAAWIPATFKDQHKGRTLSNLNRVTCIVLDIDHGMKFDDAVVLVKNWNYEAVLHTSYSHTPEEHRFRVIFPLASPIAANQTKPLFNLMQATFENKLDPACLEPSRLFYLPSCGKGAEVHFRYEHVQGHLLSLSDAGCDPTNTSSFGAIAEARSNKLAAASPLKKVSVGGRHIALSKLTGTLLAKGLNDDDVMTKCLLWNMSLDEPLPEAEVDKTVKDICSKDRFKTTEAQSDWNKVVDGMNSKYAWLNKPLAIYRFWDGAIVSGKSLIAQYANRRVTIKFDGTMKNVTHFDAWLKSSNRREHDDLAFLPGQPEIVNNCVNLWKAWGANPVAGDVTPWVQLMDHIFGVGTSERAWMEQWFAYPLQHPGTKLKTCVVIWGTHQGVGKSMLGNTVGKLYGRHAKTITAKELHGNFNGWAQESLFVLGEENSSGDHRADSNKLKELITGDSVYIEEKYRISATYPNQMNFLFTSNHPDAFHLETADRRYFVWAIDKAPMPRSFYDGFVAWRNSDAGLPALMAHLLSVDLTGFAPHGDAPMTTAKLDMKDMSKTELERWITDALGDHTIDERFKAEVMATQELVRLYQLDTGAARSSDTALAKALRRQTPYAKRRIVVGKGKKISAISLRNHEYWESQSDGEWVLEFNKYSSMTTS